MKLEGHAKKPIFPNTRMNEEGRKMERLNKGGRRWKV